MNKLWANIGLVVLIVGFGIVSCGQPVVPQNKVVVDLSHSDDLSKYNPMPVVEKSEGQDTATRKVVKNEPISTPFDISDRLNHLIDSVTMGNDSIRTISGYTVLVYSGNDQIEAGRVRNRLFDIVPELDARFSYRLPTYFVKVGQFYQQIEAQPLYRKIREHYPTASIVPDKFPIDK